MSKRLLLLLMPLFILASHATAGVVTVGQMKFNTDEATQTATWADFTAYRDVAVVVPRTVTDENGVEYTVTGMGNLTVNAKKYITSIDLSQVSPQFSFDGSTQVFSNFQKLTTVIMPDEVAEGSLVSSYMFSGSPVTSVTFPKGMSITSSVGYVFNNCTSLVSIDLSELDATSLPGNFFATANTATTATKVTLPHNLKRIERTKVQNNVYTYPFAGLTSLQTLILPDGVEYIGENALDGLQVTTLIIPASVTEMSANGILGSLDNTLTDVWLSWTTPPANCSVDAFLSSVNLQGCVFHLPSREAYNNFMADSEWKYIVYDNSYDYPEDPLTLADNGDNLSTLTNVSGQSCDVTLSGRTLYKDGAWNTLCLPFTLTATQMETSPLVGATVMELVSSSMDGGTVCLSFHHVDGITAGVPCLIKWESGSNVTNPTFRNVTIGATEPTDVATTFVTFKGTFAPTTLTGGDKTTLYLASGNHLYYPGANMTIRSFRAYFQLSEALSATDFVLQFDEQPSGISSLSSETIVNNSWYDLGGRILRQRPTAKGIYIHNGRKIVIP